MRLSQNVLIPNRLLNMTNLIPKTLNNPLRSRNRNKTKYRGFQQINIKNRTSAVKLKKSLTHIFHTEISLIFHQELKIEDLLPAIPENLLI